MAVAFTLSLPFLNISSLKNLSRETRVRIKNSCFSVSVPLGEKFVWQYFFREENYKNAVFK